jgi:hypothetical protein
LVCMGFHLKALHLLSNLYSIWATPPVHFALVILLMGVSWIICSDWPWTVILQISVSQVASIAGMRHRCPDYGNFFLVESTFKRKPFWDWLILLSMFISSSIHFPANDIISFFLMAEQYSIVYTYYFFYPFIGGGHPGQFHTWLLWIISQKTWMCR